MRTRDLPISYGKWDWRSWRAEFSRAILSALVSQHKSKPNFKWSSVRKCDCLRVGLHLPAARNFSGLKSSWDISKRSCQAPLRWSVKAYSPDSWLPAFWMSNLTPQLRFTERISLLGSLTLFQEKVCSRSARFDWFLNCSRDRRWIRWCTTRNWICFT